MFPNNICQNINILVVLNVQKNNFGFHGNKKTQGQEHQVNNFHSKYQVCQMKLRHFDTFLQFRLLFHEPHCSLDLKLKGKQGSEPKGLMTYILNPPYLGKAFTDMGDFLLLLLLLLLLCPPPPLKSQSQGPNPSLKAHIPALMPKSQPLCPNPSLKAQILVSRPKS